MAFSLEAAIITPVVAILIVTTITLGAKESSDTVKTTNEAADAMHEGYLRRSGTKLPDRIIVIETADLLIDLYGTISDITFIDEIAESVR